jgi:hypothetical protein
MFRPFRLRASPFAAGRVWSVVPWLFGFALVVVGVRDVFEGDLFFHLRLGEWMLAAGGAAGDPAWLYGPNRGSAWVNTMAPAEVLLALAYRAGGWGAVQLLQALAAPAMLAALCVAAAALAPRMLSGRSPWPARAVTVFVVAFAVAVAGPLTVRPQTVSLVAVVLLMVAVYRVAATGRFPRVVPAVVLTWLWVCWHGYGVLVVPFLLLGAFARLVSVVATTPSGRWRAAAASTAGLVRRGWLVSAVGLAVTFLTPAGAGLWGSVAAVREAAGAIITEWQPVVVSDLLMAWAALPLAVWLVSAAGSWMRGSRRRGAARLLVAEGVLVVVLVAFGFTSLRSLLLAAVALAVVAVVRLARFAALWPGRDFSGERLPAGWLGLAVKVATVAVSVGALLVLSPQVGVDERRVPTALFTEVAGVPGPQRVLTHWDVASPLPFLHPSSEIVTATDGRADYFGADVLLDYVTLVEAGEGWESVWEKYSGTTDVVLRDTQGLLDELAARGWSVGGRQSVENEDGSLVSYVWLRAPQAGAQGR